MSNSRRGRLRTCRRIAAVAGVLAVVVGCIAVITSLLHAATAGRDAEKRLVTLRLYMSQLQDVPWGAAPGNGDKPSDVHDELIGDIGRIKGIVASLDRAEGLPGRSEIMTPFRRATAALWQIFDDVRHDRDPGPASEVSAVQLAKADAALRQAARGYRSSSVHSLWQAEIGSAAVIVALFLGFAWFYGRSWRANRGRMQALALAQDRAEQMQHQALHDALTGLPNRALINDRATQMLSRARREQTQIAALFIDLDNFKDINDTLGHPVGDELLQAAARRLTSAVRDTDTVGRLGGDEFVVLADGPSMVAGPELIAERVLEVLSKPFYLAGKATGYTVSASIGLAVGAFESADVLLRNADVALYEAKAAGKNTFAIFEQQMQDQVNRRLALDLDLRDALDDAQFFLVFQPTFDIARGTMRGAEALLRWRHPIDGIIGPDEFIPLLECTGLIVPVGRWVLAQACRFARSCARIGHPTAMSVNVSPQQLSSPEFVADVQAALEDSGLDADLLTLEITEATLMRDTGETVVRLNQLKALGVRLAIDDFGTGYSSLAYLQQFPVDVIKIDRMFVNGLTDGYDAMLVTRSLVQLGKTLGLEVVAEGIESNRQLAQLQRDECDTGQGYLYSYPLTSSQFTDFLATHEPASPTPLTRRSA